MRYPNLLILAAMPLPCAALLAQTELDTLLAQLPNGPLESTLSKLEKQPLDPRTITALQNAFESRHNKRDKQLIASALLRFGNSSARYFDYLARYAGVAIEDQMPLFEKFDDQGKSVRGQLSAEFENWCALNHKDPNEMAALQFTVYPADVKILAEVDDPRALDLFRKGLDSPNPGVVAYSVEGLGRLHDMSALPLIEQAFQRLPSGDRMAVPMELPWYDRPEAYQLMQRLNPNPATLSFDIQQVERMRLAEAQAAQARAGKAKLR